MKQLKRLAFVTVPMVVAVGLSGVAHAAPASDASNAPGSRAAALAEVESAVATLAARPSALPEGNYIFNSDEAGFTGGLGVIHVKDGSYTHGLYDAVLPTRQFSDFYFGWSTTSGWYTGPGYCTVQYRSDDGGSTWRQQSPDLGSGQHFIGGSTSYEVAPYIC